MLTRAIPSCDILSPSFILHVHRGLAVECYLSPARLPEPFFFRGNLLSLPLTRLANEWAGVKPVNAGGGRLLPLPPIGLESVVAFGMSLTTVDAWLRFGICSELKLLKSADCIFVASLWAESVSGSDSSAGVVSGLLISLSNSLSTLS